MCLLAIASYFFCFVFGRFLGSTATAEALIDSGQRGRCAASWGLRHELLEGRKRAVTRSTVRRKSFQLWTGSGVASIRFSLTKSVCVDSFYFRSEGIIRVGIVIETLGYIVIRYDAPLEVDTVKRSRLLIQYFALFLSWYDFRHII